MSKPRLRVAICGGGISGLCLAVALSKFKDIECHVYEAAQRFREIGAGVMIWTKTWQIIELMGLAEEFSKIAHAPPDGSLGVGFDYRRSDQPEEGFRFHLVEVPHGCIRFHRAQFLDVFVNKLDKSVATFGKRLVAYDDSSSNDIILEFSDGTKASCDVLLGCDGIKSIVRTQMFQAMAEVKHELTKYVEPVWSGTIAYRGLIPAEHLRADAPHSALLRPMMYCGKSKHVVSYSISQGDIVNVITFSSESDKDGTPFDGPWVTECSRSELLACYEGWEPEVQNLLKNIDKPTKWALHYLRPLPFYVKDRIALVGDAAHAMLPHQGAGAGQAMEDAYLLAQLLGSPLSTRATVHQSLLAYQAVRLPLANHVLEGSKESGLMYEFNSVYADDYTQLGPAIQSQWDWVWKTTPQEDVQKAVVILEKSVT